ncbi:hypothetical protein ACJX0J_016580, partial [Zea mays]
LDDWHNPKVFYALIRVCVVLFIKLAINPAEIVTTCCTQRKKERKQRSCDYMFDLLA